MSANTTLTCDKRKWIIAVHCGAGYHNPKNATKYKEIMSIACRTAARILNDLPRGGSRHACIDAVTQAIAVLEDCDFTNAGLGSNLTEVGTVECDASIMSGHAGGLYGAVGAVMGVRNPIRLASQILYDMEKGLGTLGRVKPIMLVGRGAWRYCLRMPHCQGIVAAQSEKELERYLVTERAMATWQDHTNRVKQFEQRQSNRLFLQNDEDQHYDTVGAVCIDREGNVCAGVSSGGISLKYEGRVGEAALYGAGCWANQQDNGSRFACSCTGIGEDIMYNSMARKCYETLCATTVNDAGMFLDTCLAHVLSCDASPLLPKHTTRSAGILALHCLDNNKMELGWAYTTKSMAIGYMTSEMNDCVSFVSNNKSGSENNIQLGIMNV